MTYDTSFLLSPTLEEAQSMLDTTFKTDEFDFSNLLNDPQSSDSSLSSSLESNSSFLGSVDFGMDSSSFQDMNGLSLDTNNANSTFNSLDTNNLGGVFANLSLLTPVDSSPQPFFSGSVDNTSVSAMPTMEMSTGNNNMNNNNNNNNFLSAMSATPTIQRRRARSVSQISTAPYLPTSTSHLSNTAAAIRARNRRLSASLASVNSSPSTPTSASAMNNLISPFSAGNTTPISVVVTNPLDSQIELMNNLVAQQQLLQQIQDSQFQFQQQQQQQQQQQFNASAGGIGPIRSRPRSKTLPSNANLFISTNNSNNNVSSSDVFSPSSPNQTDEINHQKRLQELQSSFKVKLNNRPRKRSVTSNIASSPTNTSNKQSLHILTSPTVTTGSGLANFYPLTSPIHSAPMQQQAFLHPAMNNMNMGMGMNMGMNMNFANTPNVMFIPVSPQPTPTFQQQQHRSSITSLPPTFLTQAELLKTLDEELCKVDMQDITVMELKDLLRARGLPSSGKKAVLMERLVEEMRLAAIRREKRKMDSSNNTQEPVVKQTQYQQQQQSIMSPTKLNMSDMIVNENGGANTMLTGTTSSDDLLDSIMFGSVNNMGYGLNATEDFLGGL